MDAYPFFIKVRDNDKQIPFEVESRFTGLTGFCLYRVAARLQKGTVQNFISVEKGDRNPVCIEEAAVFVAPDEDVGTLVKKIREFMDAIVADVVVRYASGRVFKRR